MNLNLKKKEEFCWDMFRHIPIIGIVRNLSLDVVKNILPVYKNAGLTTIEITLNTPGAQEIIRYAVDNYGLFLNIGAGTVCSAADLDNALSCGAQFIVTPIVDEAVIKTCKTKAIPVFSGAFTPTEIYRAWSQGADMVKIFPASTLGPNYIKDIKAPFADIKLLPTGGVMMDNIRAFREAGANGFGIGSPLFDQQCIANEDWQRLQQHFEGFVKKVSF